MIKTCSEEHVGDALPPNRVSFCDQGLRSRPKVMVSKAIRTHRALWL